MIHEFQAIRQQIQERNFSNKIRGIRPSIGNVFHAKEGIGGGGSSVQYRDAGNGA